MINGKPVAHVHYLSMLRSLQRMQELDKLNEWYVCDKGQLMTDFVSFSGVLPAPSNCIVTYVPIVSWSSGSEYQWFCRIHDDEHNRDVYFTLIED